MERPWAVPGHDCSGPKSLLGAPSDPKRTPETPSRCHFVARRPKGPHNGSQEGLLTRPPGHNFSPEGPQEGPTRPPRRPKNQKKSRKSVSQGHFQQKLEKIVSGGALWCALGRQSSFVTKCPALIFSKHSLSTHIFLQCFSVTKCPGPILKGGYRESFEEQRLTTTTATTTVTTTINYDDDDTSTTTTTTTITTTTSFCVTNCPGPIRETSLQKSCGLGRDTLLPKSFGLGRDTSLQKSCGLGRDTSLQK